MYVRGIIVGGGVRVGSVDMVDGDEFVELYGFLGMSLCGKSWGLTLGKHCMQSSHSVIMYR